MGFPPAVFLYVLTSHQLGRTIMTFTTFDEAVDLATNFLILPFERLLNVTYALGETIGCVKDYRLIQGIEFRINGSYIKDGKVIERTICFFPFSGFGFSRDPIEETKDTRKLINNYIGKFFETQQIELHFSTAIIWPESNGENKKTRPETAPISFTIDSPTTDKWRLTLKPETLILDSSEYYKESLSYMGYAVPDGPRLTTGLADIRDALKCEFDTAKSIETFINNTKVTVYNDLTVDSESLFGTKSFIKEQPIRFVSNIDDWSYWLGILMEASLIAQATVGDGSGTWSIRSRVHWGNEDQLILAINGYSPFNKWEFLFDFNEDFASTVCSIGHAVEPANH